MCVCVLCKVLVTGVWNMLTTSVIIGYFINKDVHKIFKRASSNWIAAVRVYNINYYTIGTL